MLARQSLGVPGTASFLPFGAMIFPCFFPFMYRHPLLTSARTKAATSLLLLYRMVIVGVSAIRGANPQVLLRSLRRALVGCAAALRPSREADSGDLPAIRLGSSRLDAGSSLGGHWCGLSRRLRHEKPFKKSCANRQQMKG